MRTDLRRVTAACYFFDMSTLAEMEHAVEALPLAEQEALFRLLAARFDAKSRPSIPYCLRTQPGGVRPGIDPNKLGQLPEDF